MTGLPGFTPIPEPTIQAPGAPTTHSVIPAPENDAQMMSTEQEIPEPAVKPVVVPEDD